MENNNFLLRGREKQVAEIAQKIKMKDRLMEDWDKECSNKLFPSAEWKKGKRTASLFTMRAITTLLLGCVFVVTVPFLAVYWGYLFTTRLRLRDEISTIIHEINCFMPIPLNEKDYSKMKSDEGIGKRATEHIFFKKEVLNDADPSLFMKER